MFYIYPWEARKPMCGFTCFAHADNMCEAKQQQKGENEKQVLLIKVREIVFKVFDDPKQMIGWPIDRSIFVRISPLCKHISKSLFYSSHPLPNCPSPTDYRWQPLWKIEIQTEKYTRDEWKSIKAMTRSGRIGEERKTFKNKHAYYVS